MEARMSVLIEGEERKAEDEERWQHQEQLAHSTPYLAWWEMGWQGVWGYWEMAE